MRRAPPLLGRLALCCAFGLGGCPESCLRQPPPDALGQREVAHQAAAQAKLVSREPPQPQHPGKGIFNGEIAYLGYDTEPRQPRAGGQVTVTLYFQALKELHRDWQVFVHADPRGGGERINGDHFPASGRYHTDQWKAGDYIADPFAIGLGGYLPQTQVELWMGFYIGDERLPIANPAEATNDGNNRLLAGTLQIE